jgi:uncharacterized protein YndB with AHSA1/START domain
MSTVQTEVIRKEVLVDFEPAAAFDLFTEGIARWWPVRTHSYGGDAVTNVVLESREGGRLYEVTEAGERNWGRVRTWEPPHRVVLEWEITDPATEVEVSFLPEEPGTRVVLEHRGFEDPERRGNYEGGWDVVLAPFVTAAKNA